MMRFLSFYKLSVDYGFRYLLSLLVYPVTRLLDKLTEQGDNPMTLSEIRDKALQAYSPLIQQVASSNPGIAARNVDPKWMAFGIPCAALVLLVLVLDHFLHFPLVLTIILLATLGAVMMTLLFVGSLAYMVDEEAMLQQFRQLDSRSRHRWVMFSGLFIIICLIAIIAMLFLLQVIPV